MQILLQLAVSLKSSHQRYTRVLSYFFKRFNENSSGGISTIGKDEFMESTLSIWNINPEKAKKLDPAPFPVELPKRFINLTALKRLALILLLEVALQQ